MSTTFSDRQRTSIRHQASMVDREAPEDSSLASLRSRLTRRLNDSLYDCTKAQVREARDLAMEVLLTGYIPDALLTQDEKAHHAALAARLGAKA